MVPTMPVEFPTAMQRAARVQFSPVSCLRPVRGLAALTSRQLVPFHASAKLGRGPAPWLTSDPPTAMQRKARVQDTDQNELICPGRGFGVGSTRQLVPFHASATGSWPRR